MVPLMVTGLPSKRSEFARMSLGEVLTTWAETGVATASRQQSVVTRMEGERRVIGSPLQGVASSAWNESDCAMPRANFLPLISAYVTLR